MKSFAGSILAALLVLPVPHAARASGIVLLNGGVSAPNAAERNYARVVTRRLDLWLGELAVGHEIIDESGMEPASLVNAKVVLLGYNPNPPERHLEILRSFVERGGKMIVFYGADPGLAAMLGMKLGAYKSAASGWSSMRFNDSAPPHMPEEVVQNSLNIRPVYPAAPGASVIAHWAGAGGNAGGEPACVISDRGAWVTHVLLDDGDTWNKKRLLLGLIGFFDPSVWSPAAHAVAAQAGLWGEFGGFEDAVRGIKRAANGSPGEENALRWLAQSEAEYARCRAALEARRYPESLECARRADELLVKAYGCFQEARRTEFRGVWEHSGTGLFPGDWDRTCSLLKNHGMTDLLVNVLGDGRAHYKTRVLRSSGVFAAHGDQLAACVAAGHRYGLKVHAWKLCWRVEGAPEDWLAGLKRTGRLQVTDTGRTVNWLCPAHVDNLKLEKDSIREIVGRYEVDGIHLDYIRYPDGHSCYCATCRAAFEAAIGKRLANWPGDVLTGSFKKEYTRWRRNQITRLVADISAFARKRRPAIKISASVYGRYPLCADSVGQDWGEWLRDGYVDFVCPMNYTHDLKRFQVWTLSQVMLPYAKNRIYPGIGVTATESRLSPVEVIDQIVALRKLGAGGFTLFDLDGVLAREILPVLDLGITAAP